MKEPTLIEKQFMFSRRLADLIMEACSRGYSVTMGETYRPPETAALYAKKGIGIKRSLHCLRLAADILLFKNNVYQKDWKEYQELGNLWKSYSSSGMTFCWGGDWTS